MTDDFERDLSGMLNDRVAGMPERYELEPELLRRVQRRRTIKLAAIAAAALVVVVGTVGAVAQSFGRSDTHLSVAKPGSATVATVACPIAYSLTGGSGYAPPVLDPRMPAAGDPEQFGRLVSFAATTDPRYIVLGPRGWVCQTTVAADGQNGMGITPPSSASSAVPSIEILNDYLWHGGVGAPAACTVFDDRALMTYVKRNFPESVCHHAGRIVTRVDAHVSTFVDAHGTRGVGWMVLPSSITGPDDGKLSILTCRPGAGLTAADCDTIIADFIARNDTPDNNVVYPTPTTSTSTSVPARPDVTSVACPFTYIVTGATPFPPPVLDRRVPTGGAAALLDHLASYAATTDPRYVVLAPKGWSCQATASTDGQNGVAITDGNTGQVGDATTAPIGIINDYLWHGGVGSLLACRVFDDPAIQQYVQQHFSVLLPCRPAGRTVTSVDAHASTFVDADGARGAGLMTLPSSPTQDDGLIGVLTCRPTTGLTAADCDTIIADFIARNDVTNPPAGSTPTTTGIPIGAVPGVFCNGVLPGLPPSIGFRVPAAGDPARFGTMASYSANYDGDPRFTALGPRSWSCEETKFEDGRVAEIVFDPATRATPTEASAPIAIDHDWLWHGGVGSVTACSVFADRVVTDYVSRLYPKSLPCPRADRTVTRLNANVATFTDADGSRGAAWMLLPSARGADGFISVLTCRPTAGLTTADCDTIVADYAARADAPAGGAG
jgi:hypothetical protein